MEVSEAKEKKKEVENKITSLLIGFSKETGLSVEDIYLTTEKLDYDEVAIITNLKIKVDLL